LCIYFLLISKWNLYIFTVLTFTTCKGEGVSVTNVFLRCIISKSKHGKINLHKTQQERTEHIAAEVHKPNNGYLCNLLSGDIRLSLIRTKNEEQTIREAFMKRLIYSKKMTHSVSQ
jgi:hypothetical protein